MATAIEKLASELAQLPADKWAQLDALRRAVEVSMTAFAPEWEEASERLVQRDAMEVSE
jgi:hypothetical protein